MSEFQDGEALIKGGSRTFHAASLMFPRRYRDPALAYLRQSEGASGVP